MTTGFPGRTALLAAWLAACGWALAICPAFADAPFPADLAPEPGAGRPIALSASYVADTVAVADGPARGLRYVDLLRIDAAADLERLAGWRGARLIATAEAGTGAQANALAGTLEGIDNAEVGLNRARLFEAYLEQDLPFAAATVRLGFVDLNSDFYATDSSGLLLAPPFGIGSELAASGPNGPSIFPSTAPTAAIKLAPVADTYVQAAAISAEARVIGDPGGPAPLLRDGALLIGEAGWTGNGGKIAVGAWSYTRRQDDLHDTDGAGNPLRRRSRGGYVLVEQPLGRQVSAFVRGGISDGATTPFAGSVQAGVLIGKAIAGRPDSRFSAGVHAGFLGRKYRAAMMDAGQPQSPVETGWEVTFEDRLAPWLAVQPDAQFIRTTDARPSARDALVLALRLTFTPPGQD